jgi:hypothetical protein
MRAAAVLAPMLAGCISLSGTAGLTVDGTGRLGVSADARIGLATTLARGTGLRYGMGPGIGYDGSVAVTGLFGVDLVHLPPAGGPAYEVGAQTGIRAVRGGDDSWQWGLRAAIAQAHALGLDRVPSDPGRDRFDAWRHLGAAVDVLRASGATREQDAWSARLGVTGGFQQLRAD